MANEIYITTQAELEGLVKLNHFNLNNDVIACKCCGRFIVNQLSIALLKSLDKLRDLIGCAIITTNIFRCEKHNNELIEEAKKNGWAAPAKNSEHTRGYAADIYTNKYSAFDLAQKAYASGLFNRIGIYVDDGFIHVDLKPNEHLYWLHTVKTGYIYKPTFIEIVKEYQKVAK